MHITPQSASHISLSRQRCSQSCLATHAAPKHHENVSLFSDRSGCRQTGGITKGEWNNFPFAPRGIVAFNCCLLDVSIWLRHMHVRVRALMCALTRTCFHDSVIFGSRLPNYLLRYDNIIFSLCFLAFVFSICIQLTAICCSVPPTGSR